MGDQIGNIWQPNHFVSCFPPLNDDSENDVCSEEVLDVAVEETMETKHDSGVTEKINGDNVSTMEFLISGHIWCSTTRMSTN